MVNTYISDVFFNMDHGYNTDEIEINQYVNMDDNAENLIAMLDELGVANCQIPTVNELKDDFFNRL